MEIEIIILFINKFYGNIVLALLDNFNNNNNTLRGKLLLDGRVVFGKVSEMASVTKAVFTP
jgi:hypothetical protein